VKLTLQDQREEIQFAGILACDAALRDLPAAALTVDALHTGLHRGLIAALNDDVTPGYVDPSEAAAILASHRAGCVSVKSAFAGMARFVARQRERFAALNMLGCKEAEATAEAVTLTQKVCSGADCPFYGVPQPLAAFPRERRKADGHGNLCFTCKRAENTRYTARQRSMREAA
jgi:hypothetical protein